MTTEPVRGPIAILGTGTIGASWAAHFALHGFEVRLYDMVESARASGLQAASAALNRLQELGLATPPVVAAAHQRLHRVDTLEAMADGAGYVQESVRETYEAKHAVFARLDNLLPPDAIVASSSSGLLISEIQRVMKHPGRALIAHPFNPPHLIPLVELVAGKQTSRDTIDRARHFFTRTGKTPVIVNKEVPGHIANRLAAALWREAIDLVASGVASVEDVDKALTAGPGLRWAVMGQHMIYHLGGGTGGYRQFIDHIGKSFETYWQSMANWTSIPPAAGEAVIRGVDQATAGRPLADLARDRDQRLAAVLKAVHGDTSTD